MCRRKNAQAARIFEAAVRDDLFDDSATWVAYMVLGRDDEAADLLAGLDNAENWGALTGYRSYGFFDPRPYPYLMERLEGLGIPPKVVTTLPYQCNSVVPATGNGHSS